ISKWSLGRFSAHQRAPRTSARPRRSLPRGGCPAGSGRRSWSPRFSSRPLSPALFDLPMRCRDLRALSSRPRSRLGLTRWRRRRRRLLGRKTAFRIQQDDVVGVHEVQLFPSDLLDGKTAPVGRLDGDVQLLVLLPKGVDLQVELTHFLSNLLQLQDAAVGNQQQAQDQRRRSERHEESGERPRTGGRGWCFIHRPKAFAPGKRLSPPRSSSISRSRLYLARRSLRLAEPVLMSPELTATARSAIESSHVSPERWDTTAR